MVEIGITQHLGMATYEQRKNLGEEPFFEDKIIFFFDEESFWQQKTSK